jgi:threonylcarbamoyladenosine tRNA methylthiotransferase MtaB
VPGRRFQIQTYGCRVNQADSAALADRLGADRWTRVGPEEAADLVVLNTCTVTHRSDADVRKAVHRLRRQQPEARIVVTGCMAQRDPDGLVQLGVEGVLGNSEKHRLADLAARLERAPGAEPLVLHRDLRSGPEPDAPLDPVGGVLDRSRPFVKIQDGCDAHCTYCIIPAVRGRAQSASPDRVIDCVRDLAGRGHAEVVLTGIHLGTYGRHLDPPIGLDGLVDRLLALPRLHRLRLSCMEPMQFPESLWERACPPSKLAPHFHLPLQSGSDRTLKRMVRPYRSADYVALLRRIRKAVPRACLGTDVIVGFPGETEAEFEETLQTVEAADLDYVHVFSYSDRSGTPSERLGPKVDPKEIKRRSGVLNRWSKERWAAFLDRQIGTIRQAVTLETRQRDRCWLRTLTDNYAPVDVPLDPHGPRPARNAPITVRIDGRRGSSLSGAWIDGPARPDRAQSALRTVRR